MTKEELEKEADKWLVNNLHSTEEDYKQAYLAGAEPREKRITELEKENAELKDALKGKRCNCMTYLNFKDLEKECAKAKELIRDFISVAIDYIDKEDRNYSYIVEAEQFLNEVEK